MTIAITTQPLKGVVIGAKTIAPMSLSLARQGLDLSYVTKPTGERIASKDKTVLTKEEQEKSDMEKL